MNKTQVIKYEVLIREYFCDFFHCKNNFSTSQIFKIIITLTMFFSWQSAFSQDANRTTKYRVVAHQLGSNHIQSVSNVVKVILGSKFYVPNAFSPNGDGLNDTFGVVGHGILVYKLQVFSRSGNLIFESNDTNLEWDGTYMGNKVPVGVYVYKINTKVDRSGGQFQNFRNKVGTVTVVI